MTLVLLVPGVGMGGGTASAASTATTMSIHKRKGVWQPDVPTVTGSGVN